MIRRLTAALALAALTAVLLAGCGDDESTGASTTAEEDGDVERVVVEAEEGAFDAESVFESASPGVVTVTSIFDSADLDPILGGGGGGGGQAAGQGAGFVVSEEGEIVTNAHVVTDAQASGPNEDLNAAEEVYVQFPDRNQVPAEVLGFDAFADVALLKVDPEGLDLKPIEIGNSDEVDVGDEVAAIGAPFGAQNSNSLSVGIVSGINRSIESLTSFQIDKAIQTDASINPGNSGGPLLDAEGRVIGINQQINTRSGGNEGVGFAVPANAVTRSIEDLREDGEANYPYIGVSAQPLYPQLAEELGIDTDTGSLVDRVVPGSPADEAGIEGRSDGFRFQGAQVGRGGDVIVAVNGKELVSESDLPVLIAEHDPGEEITLEVIHADGDREDITVELEERPATLPGSG
jgi:S1-C subfamily serine protease